MINPNDLCPCWSKKKYKKCYNNRDPYLNTCTEFLNEIYPKAQLLIQEYADWIINEVSESLHLLKQKCIRSQMIICFAWIDAIANLRDIYNWYNDKSSKESFLWRVDSFLLAKKPTIEQKYMLWENIEAEWIYVMRNSLTHEFGLSSRYLSYSYIIVNWDPYLDELFQRFRKNKMICVWPIEFSILFFHGIAYMLDEINDYNNKNALEWKIRFKRLYLFLEKNWAVELNTK